MLEFTFAHGQWRKAREESASIELNSITIANLVSHVL